MMHTSSVAVLNLIYIYLSTFRISVQLLLLLLLLLSLLLFDYVIVTIMHMSHMRLIKDTRISKALCKNEFKWNKINYIFDSCYYVSAEVVSRRTNIAAV